MPVETKVKASTAAAAVSGIVLWIIGRYAFKGGAVPDVVASWVYVAVPAVVTFGAGYLAKHTPRPAPAASALMGAGVSSAAAASGVRDGEPLEVIVRSEKTLMPPAAPGPAPGQEA
jgi:hypothetical protein